MSIEVHCSGGHTIRVKDSYAGKKGKCPRCGNFIEVPHPLSDVEIAALLDEPDEDSEHHSTSVLDGDATSSGLSLVGLSKNHYLPIKECPKCHKKVHVGSDKVCPSCSAYFTYWD